MFGVLVTPPFITVQKHLNLLKCLLKFLLVQVHLLKCIPCLSMRGSSQNPALLDKLAEKKIPIVGELLRSS